MKSKHKFNYKWYLRDGYPLDYNFLNVNAKYIVGMSVPPVMMAQVAHQVYLQWINKLKK